MEKRYDHKQCEPQAQQKWESEKTYKTQNSPGELYSIDTPPPTVSGNLHIGHIFSYTQTDIIARYKRMSGYSVFYPFGFDDNGLPTEKYVEKKLKIRAHDLSRSELIKLCLQETETVEETFKQLWQRMGLSVDWDACYSTISESVRKISQESFIDLYKKGHIYRKFEPALYCTTCRTSVAQAELDDIQEPSFFNDIVFKDEQGNNLLVGTTRPELLSSCVALLFNPNDTRYKHLKGQQAIVPVFENKVQILEDEHVEIEKGTGLVMCCTFGDKTDIAWYKKFNLPYKQSIGFDGKWTQDTGILAGLRVKAARETILEELKNQNLLVEQKPITHAVNVHERCKKPIEFVVLSQWFLNILDHKEKFLELGDNINWSPSFMKARYRDWVENLGWDWCLSRQRFYGIPFPVWHCKDCDEVLLADEKDLPIDPQETTYPGTTCNKCNSSNIVADTDVMDTWNTSSLTPYICSQLYNNDDNPLQNSKNFLPMSMRPQAHDIIRTWAFYTIIKSWFHNKTLPWTDIVISGHVLSNDKEKLSKSKGNSALSPENLLERYPADVIRYWTASGNLGHDVAFSENQLKIGQKLVTKLWNAFRFVQEHVQAYDAKHEPQQLGVINEWIMHESAHTFAEYKKYFDNNEFGLALSTVEKFFWQNFCDNYLELVKDQLFNPDNYPTQTVKATQHTLYHVGLQILQLYAPYLPHVTETLYINLYSDKTSLHQTRFADVQTAARFDTSAQLMHMIINVVSQVRKLKTEQQLSLKTELATLTVYVDNTNIADAFTQEANLIKGATKAHEFIIKQESSTTSVLQKLDDMLHAHISLQAK